MKSRINLNLKFGLCAILMVTQGIIVRADGQASERLESWRRAIVANGFTEVGRAIVDPSSRRQIQQTCREIVGWERVQMSRPHWMATNECGRVADLPFLTEVGERCNFGVQVVEDRCEPLYLTLIGQISANVSERDALEFLKVRFFPQGTGCSSIYTVGRVLSSSKTEVKRGMSGGTIPLPFEDFYLFFVDDLPGANWGHPSRIAFVTADLGAVVILRINEPIHVLCGSEHVRMKCVCRSSGAGIPGRAEGRQHRRREPGFLNLSGTNGAIVPGDSSHCHALIISGGCNPYNNHIRYWNDVCFAYNVLVKRYAVPRENIRVLWAGGDPAKDFCTKTYQPFCDCLELELGDMYDFDLDGNRDINGAATRENVIAALKGYEKSLQTTDQLFVFVTDHGGTYPNHNTKCNDQATLCLWRGEDDSQDLRDSELASLTAGIKCPVVFAMETCYSGGMIDEIVSSAKNRVVLTADVYDPSKAGFDCYIDFWVLNLFGALNGSFPAGYDPEHLQIVNGVLDVRSNGVTCSADLNGDGHVSFYEAHAFAAENNVFVAANGCTGESIDEPQCQDPGLAKKLFLTQYADAEPVVVREKVPTPVLTPVDGALRFAPFKVTASCLLADATIRYTTDGSAPTDSSAVYRDAITVERDCTVSVRAFKSGMDGSATASFAYMTRKTAPEAPMITSVSQGKDTTGIVVEWLAGAGTAGFEILRSETESMASATVVGSGLSATETCFVDTAALRGVDYYYAVRAINAYGSTVSSASQRAILSVMPPLDGQASVRNLKISSAEVEISWSPVPGAGYYRVFRNTVSGGVEPIGPWQTRRSLTFPVTFTGTEEFSCYIKASVDGNGKGESVLGPAIPVVLSPSLGDASFVLCSSANSSVDEDLVVVQPGATATSWIRLAYSDGTFEMENFHSGVKCEVVSGKGVSAISKDGSYSRFSTIVRYTPPSIEISADARASGNAVVRLSYEIGAESVTRDVRVIVSADPLLRLIRFSSIGYLMCGESEQLAVYGEYYGSTEMALLPEGQVTEWSIVSGSGAVLSEDGVLTILPVQAKSEVVIQARVQTVLGPLSATAKINVWPGTATKQVAVIPPLGGASTNFVGYIPAKAYCEKVSGGDWVTGRSYLMSRTKDPSGIHLEVSFLGGVNGQIWYSNEYIFFSLLADRNPGKDRDCQYKLRWDGGGVDFTVIQQEAPHADDPSVTVASDGSISAGRPADGSVVHYATDGEEPSDQSPVLNTALSFKDDTPVAVKAFGEWMQASNTIYENAEGTENRRAEVRITFDPMESGVLAPASRTYHEGDKYGELPELKKTGLFFKGWSIYREAVKKVGPLDYVPGEDRVLYAIWSKIAADEPEWTANAWTFKSAMSANMIVTDVKSGKTLDPAVCMIGIEDSDAVCRGSTASGQGNAKIGTQTGSTTHAFGIYSQVEAGIERGLEIRVWHPDYGYLKVLNPELTFTANGTLGTADAPYVVQVELVAEDPSADVTFGVGKVSRFMMSSVEQATVVGVEGLRARVFRGTDYYGGTCFVNPSVIDVEKTAAADDDDVWCSFFSDMNLLFLTGWSSLGDYAGVEDMAAYFRKNPKLLVYKSGGQLIGGKWAEAGIFPWFESVSKVTMGDAIAYGNAGEDYVRLLPQLLANGDHALHLTVAFLPVEKNPKFKGEYSFHGVTCCGYAIDTTKQAGDRTALTGLFIIESDNDQLTGTGGKTAPNSIIYCPVTWMANPPKDELAGVWYDEMRNPIGGYAIEGLWGQTGYVASEYVSLRNFTPQQFDIEATGWSGTVDSRAHGLTVTVRNCPTAKIEYQQANGTWATTKRSFTAAGEYEVSFRVSAKGFETFFGSATVNILPKVVFDTAGGAAQPAERGITPGAPFGELPVVERVGYTFGGWRNDTYGIVDCDTIVRDYEVVTLHAIWTAHQYAVRFHANDGGDDTYDQQFTYDKAQALDPNTFANGELHFAGWAILPDGPAVYANRRNVVNLTAEDGAVVDLYAVWSENPPVSWTEAQLFYGTYADAKEKTGAVTVTTAKGTEKDGVVSATFTAKVKINGKTYSYKGGKIVDGEVTKLPTSSTKGAPKFSELELDGLGVSGTVGGQSLSGERIEKPVIVGITESANAMVGVRYESEVRVENPYGGIAYSASGLPDGLKINASTGVISGVPTKAKTYSKVKITATSKVSSSYKTTETREIVIAALPKWTQGTFTGKAELGDLKGPVKVTVGSTGKISASIILGGTNWTYSASGYSVESCVSEEDFFSCGMAKAKIGKKTVEASFDFALLRNQKGDAFEPTILFAGLTLTDGYADITAWRNPWKDVGGARILSNLVGAYTWYDGKGGTLKLTVNSSGTVKVAGKLGNGRSLSLSTPLIYRNDDTASVILHASAATEKIDGKKTRVPVFFRELTLFDYAATADAGGDLVYRDPCVRASIGPESTGTGSISYSTSLGQGAPGSTVKVTAKAKAGSVLAYWRKQNGDIVGYGSSCSVNLDVVDLTDLIAVFRLKTDYGDNPEPFFIDEDVFANMVVGVQFETRVEVGLDSYPVKFTATGLPKGLSLDATTGVISGVPTATCTDKAVTITATSTANKSLKGTVSCRATAVSLPFWVQGSFTGRMELGNFRGSAKVTVGSTGKISASFALGGTNWTCSVVGLSRDSDPDGGSVQASGMAKATIGKKTVTAPFWFGALRASVDGQLEPTLLEGGLTIGDTDAVITAWRNPWKDSGAANVLSTLVGSYTWSDGEGGKLKLTVASSGTVKVAGKLGNGRTLSLSVPLIYDEEGHFVHVVLYAAAKKEKVGTKTKSYPAFFRELSLVGYASAPGIGGDYVYRDPCVRASADQSSTGAGGFSYSTSLGQGAPGSTVKVTAKAASGSVFACWLRGGEIVGLGTSLSVILPEGADIGDLTAVFRRKSDFVEECLGIPEPGLRPVEGLEASGDFGNLSVGVQFKAQATVDPKFYPVKFTATGLPKGLSIDATTGVVSGVPTAACTDRKVVITAVCAANGDLRGSATFENVSVSPLPKWARGTFKGRLGFTVGPLVGKSGSCTVTVGPDGKVSGAVKVGSKTYSFGAPGYVMFDEYGYNLYNCTMTVGSSKYEVFFDACPNGGESDAAYSLSFRFGEDWTGTELSK